MRRGLDAAQPPAASPELWTNFHSCCSWPRRRSRRPTTTRTVWVTDRLKRVCRLGWRPGCLSPHQAPRLRPPAVRMNRRLEPPASTNAEPRLPGGDVGEQHRAGAGEASKRPGVASGIGAAAKPG